MTDAERISEHIRAIAYQRSGAHLRWQIHRRGVNADSRLPMSTSPIPQPAVDEFASLMARHPADLPGAIVAFAESCMAHERAMCLLEVQMEIDAAMYRKDEGAAQALRWALSHIKARGSL